MILRRLSGLACAVLLLSACSGPPAAPPRMDGPATVVPQGEAYHVLLAESQDFGYRCPPGTTGPAVTDHGRFVPTPARVAATEGAFRDALRRAILAGSEAMALDSVATITEFYGNVAVPREVGRDELVRMMEQEYDRALGWDRQYAGVISASGDSVLVVNAVSPVLEAREVLADQWVVPPATAAGYVKTVAYEPATGAALSLCGGPGS